MSSCSSIGPPFAATILVLAIVNLISYLQLLRLVRVKEERPLFLGSVYTSDVFWLHRCKALISEQACFFISFSIFNLDRKGVRIEIILQLSEIASSPQLFPLNE
jgi:hypothetical protein